MGEEIHKVIVNNGKQVKEAGSPDGSGSFHALPGNSNRANLGGAFPQLLPLRVASLSLPCESTEAS